LPAGRGRDRRRVRRAGTARTCRRLFCRRRCVPASAGWHRASARAGHRLAGAPRLSAGCPHRTPAALSARCGLTSGQGERIGRPALIDSTLLTAFATAVATSTDFDAWLQDEAHALFSPAAVFAGRWRAECGDAPVPGRLGELYVATVRAVQAQPAELALETLDLAVSTWQAYRCAYPAGPAAHSPWPTPSGRPLRPRGEPDLGRTRLGADQLIVAMDALRCTGCRRPRSAGGGAGWPGWEAAATTMSTSLCWCTSGCPTRRRPGANRRASASSIAPGWSPAPRLPASPCRCAPGGRGGDQAFGWPARSPTRGRRAGSGGGRMLEADVLEIATGLAASGIADRWSYPCAMCCPGTGHLGQGPGCGVPGGQRGQLGKTH